MFEIFEKLNVLLSSGEWHRAKVVFLLMLVMAFMETVGVASIMPFVAVLAKPEIVETNRYLASAYNMLGFTSTNTFLIFLGVVVFVLFISSLTFKALTTYAITRFTTMRLHSISCRLLSAYLRQPYEFFLNRNTADLGKSILSEVSQVTSGVLLPVLRVISGTVVAFALLCLLLYIEPVISLCVAVLLGGSYALVYFQSRKLLRRIGKDRLRANKERFILANEALNGIKELKLMGREWAYLYRFNNPSQRFAHHQAVSKVIGSLPKFGIQAVAFGGVLLLTLYLLYRHEGLEGALPLIALYALAGNRLLPAFHEIFSNLAQLRFSLPVLDNLYNDLTLKEHNAASRRERTAPKLNLHKCISLENVTYRYPGSVNNALNSVNLIIPAGTIAGFVGSTGAGKSTVIDLILGLLTPTSGQIMVDDSALNPGNLRGWQDNIGYVPQSIYLADDTVAANIAFGVSMENIDYAALERAAKMAHIHDFITRELPKGYDSIVGERGIRLSGGQRQRLAIARALYNNPDVVVFDEATSALDNATEKAIMEAIEELHGQKTVILIAHRLTTVYGCDRIFVLQDGVLIDEGTYSSLMEISPGFRRLAMAASS